MHSVSNLSVHIYQVLLDYNARHNQLLTETRGCVLAYIPATQHHITLS